MVYFIIFAKRNLTQKNIFGSRAISKYRIFVCPGAMFRDTGTHRRIKGRLDTLLIFINYKTNVTGILD